MNKSLKVHTPSPLDPITAHAAPADCIRGRDGCDDGRETTADGPSTHRHVVTTHNLHAGAHNSDNMYKTALTLAQASVALCQSVLDRASASHATVHLTLTQPPHVHDDVHLTLTQVSFNCQLWRWRPTACGVGGNCQLPAASAVCLPMWLASTTPTLSLTLARRRAARAERHSWACAHTRRAPLAAHATADVTAMSDA